MEILDLGLELNEELNNPRVSADVNKASKCGTILTGCPIELEIEYNYCDKKR